MNKVRIDIKAFPSKEEIYNLALKVEECAKDSYFSVTVDYNFHSSGQFLLEYCIYIAFNNLNDNITIVEPSINEALSVLEKCMRARITQSTIIKEGEEVNTPCEVLS